VIHRFPIPFGGDGPMPDFGGWLHRWGWDVAGLVIENDRLHFPQARYLLTLDGRWAGVPARIEASSGAVLVYDDIERTLGVTDKRPGPGPEDAVPDEPEDAVPPGFTGRPVGVPLLRDRSYDAAWWLPWPLGPKRGASLSVGAARQNGAVPTITPTQTVTVHQPKPFELWLAAQPARDRPHEGRHRRGQAAEVTPEEAPAPVA
jgi:hypothetical protein